MLKSSPVVLLGCHPTCCSANLVPSLVVIAQGENEIVVATWLVEYCIQYFAVHVYNTGRKMKFPISPVARNLTFH